jgi:cell shape-determining protein MreC
LNLGKSETFVGNKVYYSGVLIGEIEEIYKNTAVVRLYSSSNKTLFVNISGNETEAVGLGGAGFILTLPKDIEISELETIFVGDSPIGKVDSIESDQSGAFQNIYFRYPFNINDIEFVQISQKEN